MAKEIEGMHDVVIVGGGASGTALLYVLAKYTSIKRIALIEKYPDIGSVNSHATQNSQTLHVGDIETNYSLEKVRHVKPAALFVKKYVESLPAGEGKGIMRTVQKMVLGVDVSEVGLLSRRFDELKTLFPTLEKLDAEGIAKVEPEVMRARKAGEPILALFNSEGYTVDFGALAKAFVRSTSEIAQERTSVFLGREVASIEKSESGYLLRTSSGNIRARVVIVDADAYSLRFAKRMGYGRQYSLIPIAGTFFFSPERLRGKVYTVQDPRMPFAAVHGDSDLTASEKTRWGPTARFLPVLESNNLLTMGAYFGSSGLHRIRTWVSFAVILFNPVRFFYLVRNFFYDLPFVGKYFFAPNVRKIIPSIRSRDLKRARGYGGMRLQRVDTTTREILLGEGKIVGENIIFNMTPSPGASVCLYNAMRDAEQIEKFFEGKYPFRMQEMLDDLCTEHAPIGDEDVSLKDTYAS
jgi:malate dehydrogenase (quinone)